MLMHILLLGDSYFILPLIQSVHLTVRLLNNLLHKWVSTPQPPLPSPLARTMHSLRELCHDSGHYPFTVQGTVDALSISVMLTLCTGRKWATHCFKITKGSNFSLRDAEEICSKQKWEQCQPGNPRRRVPWVGAGWWARCLAGHMPFATERTACLAARP